MNKRRLLSLYPLNLNEALTDLMKVKPKAKKKAAQKPKAARKRTKAKAKTKLPATK